MGVAEALGWWSACRSSHYSPSACPCPAAWAASTPPPLQLDNLQTSTTQLPHTWAWLPAELHTTPFSSCSGVRRLILLNAPRTLKERTGCKERGSEWTGDRQRGQKGLKAPITMKEGTLNQERVERGWEGGAVGTRVPMACSMQQRSHLTGPAGAISKPQTCCNHACLQVPTPQQTHAAWRCLVSSAHIEPGFK